MENEEKAVWKNRDERVDKFLVGVLDKRLSQEAFTEAALIHAIRRASQSADRLSNRVAWLNGILMVLGVLGLLVTAYGVFHA
jgi:hypothetical protein